MSSPIEVFEKKERADTVAEYTKEAAEFAKMFEELKKISSEQRGPLEDDMHTWAAAYNIRIRKIQRDAGPDLGEMPPEREESSKKLEKLLMTDLPPKAYLSYLKRELDQLLKRYDELKKEHDQFRRESIALLKQAHEEKDPLKQQGITHEAKKKEEARKERLWSIQNEIGMRISPDLDRDMQYVEKMIQALPNTPAQEQKAYMSTLADMRKSMGDLREKTKQDRISSEDKGAWFPYQK